MTLTASNGSEVMRYSENPSEPPKARAMNQQVADDYQSGSEALARNAFADAYRLFMKADEDSRLPPEGLEKLSDAAFWSGRPEESLEARERAYAMYLERNEPLRAGYVAITLSRDYGERGDSVLAGSWFTRAEKLLAGAPESREFGYLELTRSFMAHYSGDNEAAITHALRAEELAKKFGDRDLQGMSLMPRAMALIHRGEVSEGLKLMDEATVAAVSGELSAEVTGAIYCNTIGVCRDMADFRRAAEWTEAAERWCKRTSIAGFPGVCRVRHAEIMSLRGSWLEAEQEAVKAADEVAKYRMPEVVWDSFKEIGLIRLRMGDLKGAEDAFNHAHEVLKAPEPGLALLQMAHGKPKAAMASITSALEEETWNRLARARLLPAMVEIAQTAGELEPARAAKDELQAIAQEFKSAALEAAAATASAIVHQMEKAYPEAAKAAREARRLWHDVGAPYEAARARALLGRALIAGGDEDAGMMELRAAKTNLEKLGALLDAGRITELLAGEKAEPETKTTVKTFMFTDIVSSTDLVQLIGDESWSNLLRWHDQTMRALFAEFRGREIKHVGDGFFVAFDGAQGAVTCAIAIQRKLQSHRQEHGFAPQVRIGIHATTALDFGGDYGGRGVHEAARIGAAAKGDEILVSTTTLEGFHVEIEDSRTVELKGIPEPVQVCSVVWALRSGRADR